MSDLDDGLKPLPALGGVLDAEQPLHLGVKVQAPHHQTPSSRNQNTYYLYITHPFIKSVTYRMGVGTPPNLGSCKIGNKAMMQNDFSSQLKKIIELCWKFHMILLITFSLDFHILQIHNWNLKKQKNGLNSSYGYERGGGNSTY